MKKNIGHTLLKLNNEKLIESSHDVSLGGILCAVAKMCIKGNKGIKISKLNNLTNKFEYFFSEDQGRYIIEINKENVEKVEAYLNKNSINFDHLGIVTNDDIVIDNETKISIEEIKKSNTTWLEDYMVN